MCVDRDLYFLSKLDNVSLKRVIDELYIFVGFANLHKKNMNIQISKNVSFYLYKNIIHLYYLKLIV